jgi:hypothetical protein
MALSCSFRPISAPQVLSRLLELLCRDLQRERLPDQAARSIAGSSGGGWRSEWSLSSFADSMVGRMRLMRQAPGLEPFGETDQGAAG